MKTTDAKIVYSPCPPSSKDVIWGKTVNGKIEFQTFGNKGWNTVAKEDILKDIFQIKEEILEELEDYIEEVTSQADWNQNDSEAVDYIKNKPAIKAGQGAGSIIEGDLAGNSSIGNYTHTEGSGTTASEGASHAEGSLTTASGYSSHAEGAGTTASGLSSHTEGARTTASGDESHAEGTRTTASGNSSHAEGGGTTASGSTSHAEGGGTTASGNSSHAEGEQTIAKHRSQHVFGECNIADPSLNTPDTRGNYVEIVGNGADENTRSNARTLDWSGNETLAGNLTIGGTITANGQEITPAEPQVQADWNQNGSEAVDYIKNKPRIKAGQGYNSIIEGNSSTANGDGSHAEGVSTTASGDKSHAEGYNTTAGGENSHAEGTGTTASGTNSHAEGLSSTALGLCSHAEGDNTTASGKNSHAEGNYTTANHKCQHVFGEYNIADPSLNSASTRGNYIEIVGNGTTTTNHSNARTLDWSGNETLAGNLTIGGTITANGQQILPQKQADWNQTTSTESDYIKNKPTKLSDFINDGEGGSPADPFITTGDVTNRISAHNSDITTHEDIRLTVASQGGRISAVEELIPAQATSSNNLADKEFVNSSISTNTANFKGTYNTLAELEATTADNNDYGFIITTDASGNTVYNRYKYDGTSWSYEYSLNNSAFTAAQWAAIQSGITSDSVTKLNGIVHDACKIQTDGFTKSSGTLAGSLDIWNTPRAAGYYSSPDNVVQIFYPEVKTANDTISADSSGVIDISAPVTGEINAVVDSAIGSLRGEVNATFKELCTQISTSTELSAATFNSIGVLTESIEFKLPEIAEGTAPEFNGQFTVDSNAAYSVSFPTGIVMRGDTTIEADGTYQFSICNGYGIIIKVN